MTSRRIALWWRLVLAAGLLAMPAASATATTPAAASAVQHAAGKSSVDVSTASTKSSPASSLHRLRHVHRAAPVAAAIAPPVVAFLVLLLGAGVVRRRTSQLVGDIRRWCSSRAPPAGTGHLVPFGFASGRAGRLSRSHRALFTSPIPGHC